METLKYTVIKTEEQYNKYCNELEELIILNIENGADEVQDVIDLLTLLIEKWDEKHNTINDLDPIQLLKSLMKDHNMKSKDLVNVLSVSKSLVSSILNYRRGLSKENIRVLAEFFKLSQEAFNRPYKLISTINKRYKYANLMNTTKDLTKA